MKQRHGAFADVGLASLRIPLIKYSLDFPIFSPTFSPLSPFLHPTDLPLALASLLVHT